MAKEEVEKEVKKKSTKKTSKKVSKTAEKKSSTQKEIKEVVKKTIASTEINPPKKRSASTKAQPACKKTTTKATSKTTSSKQAPIKKAVKTSAKVANTKKTTSKKSFTNEVDKTSAKAMLTEYYDLPYRYNQTIVKILAQTPTTLFVYWDVSDEDRNALTSMHGEHFFYETKPVLIVHNTTHDYSFEIEINDFANSWYIRTQEPNCNYVIELGRKWTSNQEEYIYIDSSNHMTSPNDHILFENANLGNVLFKNVKTNQLSSKDFGSLKFIRDIDKLYGNIYDVYSAIYDTDTFNELTGPSSGEFYLKR